MSNNEAPAPKPARKKGDRAKSVTIRIDDEIGPKMEQIRRHMTDRLPGIRPTSADIARFAVLELARYFDSRESAGATANRNAEAAYNDFTPGRDPEKINPLAV